jgi:hypothetical protein
MANHRGRLELGMAILGVVIALGCASAPRELDLPPQTLTDAPTSTTQEEAALVSGPRADSHDDVQAAPAEPVEDGPAHSDAAAGAEPAARRHTIVIQSAAPSEVTPRTLQQATTSERERRAASDAPIAVITNSNLAELAEGGQITIIGSPDDPTAVSGVGAPASSSAPATAGAPPGAGAAASIGAAPPGTPAGPAAAAAPVAPTEEYWRAQALKLRLDWKEAVESVDELEAEVQELRRRFYEEDDPFYRDNQIKPAWDRTLDLLAAAKTDAEDQERKLSRFLEEGRRAGALPGWLREGIELEPPATAARTPADRRRSDDPWEPKILGEDSREP